MSAEIPVWRQALKDNSHPLYKATWLLFGQNTNPAAAAQILSNQKEQVIPYLYQLLDTPELYLADALGSGNAPVNAVALLGEWQVVEAVPRLLQVLDEALWDEAIHESTLKALKQMGEVILPQVLAFAEKSKTNQAEYVDVISLATVLGGIGQNSPEAYAWNLSIFQESNDEFVTPFLAEILLDMNETQALEDIASCVKQRKFTKPIRKQLDRMVRDVQAGKL